MKNHFCLTPLFLDEPVPGLEGLVNPDWRVNKPPWPDGDITTRMSTVHEAIACFVVDTLAAGQRPVSIAGDCCTAIGMLAGLQRAGLQPTLIWFDAHGDFNTMATTPSGFLGGMPLAMIVGRGDLGMPAAVGLDPLPENQVILTDGRDLDPPERDLIVNSGVIHLSDPTDLLDFSLPGGPLYIHFDVDVVSLEDSPAQNYPAEGGPSAALLQTVFRRLAGTGRITAVSVATWNPALDPDRISETTSLDLLETLIGEKTR
jgi:arginase